MEHIICHYTLCGAYAHIVHRQDCKDLLKSLVLEVLEIMALTGYRTPLNTTSTSRLHPSSRHPAPYWQTAYIASCTMFLLVVQDKSLLHLYTKLLNLLQILLAVSDFIGLVLHR